MLLHPYTLIITLGVFTWFFHGSKKTKSLHPDAGATEPAKIEPIHMVREIPRKLWVPLV